MLGYPWEPHKSIHLNNLNRQLIPAPRAYKTRTQAAEYREELAQYNIDRSLIHQINDGLHLSIQNSLNHITNTETRSLANARIPSSVTHDNTLRFLIAFMYEK